MGPEQKPTESATFEEWRNYKIPEKSSEFHYSDSTSEHILDGESQHFNYGRDPLPEKM